MLAGTLEIELIANMARLQKDMAEVNRSVGGAMGAIDSAVGMAKNALGALGAVSLVAAFAANIKAAIDQADVLNKLAQRTGLATETLSQLQYAAKMAGISNDTLSTGIKKLNISIAEGLAGDKAKIAMFHELGIKLTDTSGKAKTVDTVLLNMADAFATAKDGAGKTTISVGLLGKAGDEMIPMLNGGSQALRDMMREADKLGLTIGSDFAKQAEEFNDNLERVHASSQKLTIALAGDLVAGLGKAMKAMADATIEGGKLHGMYVGLQTLLTGDDLHKANVAAVKGVELVLAAENALTAARAKGDTERVARLEKTVALRKAELESTNNYRKMLEDDQAKSESAAAAITKARTTGRELKARNEAGEAALKAQQAFIDGLKKESDQLQLGTVQAKLNEAAKLGITGKTLKLVEAILRENEAYKEATKVARARADLRAEEEKGIAAYMLAQTEAQNAAVKASNDSLKAAQDEYAQYGLSKSQIAAITLLTLQKKQAEQYAPGSAPWETLQLQIDNQKKLIGILKDTEALDSQKDMWVSIEQAAHTAYNTIKEGGDDMWIKLRESGKAMFFDWLYQMTAKKWLIELSASVSGQNVAGAAFGSAANGLNTASSLNTLWGAGSQFLSGATAGASTASLVGANAVGAVGGDALGALIAGNGGWAGVSVAAEAGAATAATAGATAGASSVLAAIPGWGWAALGAAALFSLFGGSDGPKVQGTGSATTDFNASGSTTNRNNFGNSFDFQTAAADQYVAGLQSGYLASAKALGIANAGGTFGFGSNDSDGGKFGVGARVGSANYSSTDIKLTDEALKLEAARAVFAALQGSELPSYLKGAFDNIAATTATQEQINNTLAYAQSLKAVHDQLEAMGVNGVSKAALDGLAQFSGGIANFSANLAGFNANFLTAEEQRAKTITGIVDTLNAAGAQLTAADVAATTRETFKALVLGVKDLETEAGQRTYAALLSVQGAFASVTEATKDTTVELNTLADAQRDLQAAWSAEGARLDAANKARADTLKQAQDTVAGLRNEATTAYLAAQQKVTAAQQTLANVLQSTITSFEDVLASMDGGRSPTLQLSGARTAFDDLTARARMGDTAAIGALAGSAKSFLALSKDYSVSLQDYRRDEARVRLVMQEGIAAGQKQLKTLPVEMQQATDPIKAAYDELAKATKAEQDARVLAIAVQASLTATEKTLAERYLEAIKALPDEVALKEFYKNTMQAAADAAAVAAAAAASAAAILARLTATATNTATPITPQADTTLHGAGGTAMFDSGDISTQGGGTLYASDAIAAANAYAQAHGKEATLVRMLELGGTAEMLDRLRLLAGPSASFAVGSNGVPRDMLAKVHKGETITPSSYVDIERSARDEANALLARLVASNESLTTRLDALTTAAVETATATQRHVGLTEQAFFGEMSLQTRAAGTPA